MRSRKYQNQILEQEEWKVYNENRALKLLKAIDEIMEFNIDYGISSGKTALERLRYLLEHMEDREVINAVSFLLSEQLVSEKALIYELVNILCKYRIGDKNAYEIKSKLQKLPGIEKITYIYKGYEIKTHDGILKVYRANEILKSNSLLLKEYRSLKIDNPHLLLSLLGPNHPDDVFISCLMPSLFGGFSYESYIKLTKENGTIDIFNNTFFEKNSFESFFKPKVLVKKKGNEIETIPPLLQYAYESKKKSE